jgi:peptidoglycan/xylan/chitin deacetylase (PgdA/CDA1 family)
MKTLLVAALAAACSMATGTALAQGTQPYAWPNGARAAVSLGYDDAIDSQLDHAIPTLDKYGVKGTFFLQLSNPAVKLRLAEWRKAAANGHELGNHSLFHQCSATQPDRAWVQPQRDLDSTSAAQMADQVLVANTMLFAIDGRRERTYTVPCGDHLAAGGKDYLPAIKGQFVAIKVGPASGAQASMRGVDPYAVNAVVPIGQSGKQLIDMVKQAAANGTMISFTFHGIGGDYLENSTQAHEELVKYLAENRQLYWTDTFLNVMKYVKAKTPAVPTAGGTAAR